MSFADIHRLERDGWSVAWRRTGDGPPIVLLHATLASSAQLQSLAERLAARHTVIAVDRRGSGETRPPDGVPPGPIDVADHVADIGAIASAEGVGPVLAVGHSYGGCLALELASRRPDLVAGVWVHEPPYAPVGSAAIRAALVRVGERTAAAARNGEPGDAAEAFLAAVAGAEAVASLSPGARQRIRSAGRGALADATLLGLDPDGLARTACPVVISTGTASEPFYGVIADALLGRIPGATRTTIEGAGHGAPLSHPVPVAAAIADFAATLAGDAGASPATTDRQEE